MPIKEKKTVLYTVVHQTKFGNDMVSFKKHDEAVQYANALAQEIDVSVEDYTEISEVTRGEDFIDVVTNELREYFEVADEDIVANG